MSTTIAVYLNHEEAEDTVRALQKSGFDMTMLSVVHGTAVETEGARALLALTQHEGIAEYGDLGKNNE